MLLTGLIRMGGFALGTVAYLFLVILMIRKRSRGSVEWALLAAVSVALLWYATGAITSFYLAGVGEQPSGGLARSLQSVSWIGLALIPSAMLQVAFASLPRKFVILAYAVAPFAWWRLCRRIAERVRGLADCESGGSDVVGLLLRGGCGRGAFRPQISRIDCRGARRNDRGRGGRAGIGIDRGGWGGAGVVFALSHHPLQCSRAFYQQAHRVRRSFGGRFGSLPAAGEAGIGLGTGGI